MNKYNLRKVVFEITQKCNLSCLHCGSDCKSEQRGELTTMQILNIISQCKELGADFICLTGGELTTRSDVKEIIEYSKKKELYVSVMTNGWDVNAEDLKQADLVSFSIDGNIETHNEIRRKGSLEAIIETNIKVKKLGIKTAAVTTVMKRNIDQLKEILQLVLLSEMKEWQLQLGRPYGRLSRLDCIWPEEIDKIIDFVHQNKDVMKISLADCIGYYNKKEYEIRTGQDCGWSGCQAGKSVIGILSNGDVTGCTSIRNEGFIEGNIKDKSLVEIWNNGFKYNRNLTNSKLKGLCKGCKYTECKGGCISSRLAFGSKYSENKYCSYNNYISNKIKG